MHSGPAKNHDVIVVSITELLLNVLERLRLLQDHDYDLEQIFQDALFSIQSIEDYPHSFEQLDDIYRDTFNADDYVIVSPILYFIYQSLFGITTKLDLYDERGQLLFPHLELWLSKEILAFKRTDTLLGEKFK